MDQQPHAHQKPEIEFRKAMAVLMIRACEVIAAWEALAEQATLDQKCNTQDSTIALLLALQIFVQLAIWRSMPDSGADQEEEAAEEDADQEVPTEAPVGAKEGVVSLQTAPEGSDSASSANS